MIKIGDLSKICNVSTQTLRYYDKEGVLKPDITDSANGYRLYSVDAVEKYKKIAFYKTLGFSLVEIKEIQSASPDELMEILQRKKKALGVSAQLIRNQINTIDSICQRKDGVSPEPDILLIPFEDDPQMVGKWQLCGIIPDETDFSSLEKVTAENIEKEIIFMPGGAPAWIHFWTKGTLYRISPKYSFAIPNPYKSLNKNGRRYMIVQYMSDECIDESKDTIPLLYRQVDQSEYTDQQIRSHIDNTAYPFVDDTSVKGGWNAVDYVPHVSDFKPGIQFTEKEDLFTLMIQFFPRGLCKKTVRTVSGETQFYIRYTKGFVLNDKEMTAEEYRVESLQGKDYLFVQHKSGDYVYGGLTPHWYVFDRKET